MVNGWALFSYGACNEASEMLISNGGATLWRNGLLGPCYYALMIMQYMYTDFGIYVICNL